MNPLNLACPSRIQFAHIGTQGWTFVKFKADFLGVCCKTAFTRWQNCSKPLRPYRQGNASSYGSFLIAFSERQTKRSYGIRSFELLGYLPKKKHKEQANVCNVVQPRPTGKRERKTQIAKEYIVYIKQGTVQDGRCATRCEQSVRSAAAFHWQRVSVK